MIDEGIEPSNFLNDTLEIINFILQKKDLGDFESNLSASEAETEMINLISKNVNTSSLILFWQFILKTLDEISIVANPILSLEMLIIRLLHLKEMPSYEGALDLLSKNNISTATTHLVEKKQTQQLNEDKEDNKISKDQIKNTIQTKPQLTSLSPSYLSKDGNFEDISSFEDLIKLSSLKKEIELKYDLEKNVNLIKFSKGKIDISFNENLGKNFVRNLSEKLLDWTGKRWVITLTKTAGHKTFSEQKIINKKQILEKEKKGEIYKEFKNVFSDLELIDVKKKD